MISLELYRNLFVRILISLLIISTLAVLPALSQEVDDSQVFIAGFNAFQQKDYATSIAKMNAVLQKKPDSSFKDMALFWISRAYYKTGNQQEAARYLSQFFKEFPDNPLGKTAEEGHLALLTRAEKIEKTPVATSPTPPPEPRNTELKELDKAAVAKAVVAKQAGSETIGQKQPNAVTAEKAKVAAPPVVAPLTPAVTPAPPAVPKPTEDNTAAVKRDYREKAIEQYKNIVEKYPASPAAATATSKLRELGVTVATAPVTTSTPLLESTQVLNLEVTQLSAFEFNLGSRPDTVQAGQSTTIPFEIINRGNGKDSFYLESAFPADVKAYFAAAATTGSAISQSPELVPGETFKGLFTLTVPPGSVDGLRITQTVKAASRLSTEVSQSREIRLIASAPLLRAVLRTVNTKPLPGDRIVYRMTVLNVGSAAAEGVTFRLNFPPQLEPVDFAAAGFRQEMKSALVVDGLRVKSGESRELVATFQLKEGSAAGQELATRAELINTSLKTTGVFVSNVAYVEPQHSITVRAGSDRLLVIPGQTITVPYIITNAGNIREKFTITPLLAGVKGAVIFNDLNRDGVRQSGEPEISETPLLAPREEVSIGIEIKTPATAADNSQGSIQISLAPEGTASRLATGTTQLTYSRPVLKMVMTSRNERLKPGDIASFDLTITNSGSNLARLVELQSQWPGQLELLGGDPASTALNNGVLVWRFKEMGAGEKRVITVSFRVKSGTGVGTAIQVKNSLTYEDQLGNRY